MKPAEIERVVGTTVARGRLVLGPFCEWSVDLPGSNVVGAVLQGKAAKRTFRNLPDSYDDLVKVPKLGDKAVYSPRVFTVWVLDDDTLFYVQVELLENSVDAATAQASLVKLARVALKRV